jgi:voltage-gated potassium channel
MTPPNRSQEREALHNERWELLQHIDSFTEKPLIALSFVWLGLLILDFTTGLGPFLQTAVNVIWALFVVDFVIELIIAPRKLDYLQRNWLTAISLVLPALRLLRIVRVVRVLRAARAARSLSLIRVVSSLNRGMRALGKTLGRRGIGYVVALTVLITFGGAAGMYAFENPQALAMAGVVDQAQPSVGLGSYGEAVWWTAMIMTTLGSEYWPVTVEGRVLGWLLSLYAFAVFGYITATIASFFVGQDAEPGATGGDTAALRDEIAALRQELRALGVQRDSRYSPHES